MRAHFSKRQESRVYRHRCQQILVHDSVNLLKLSADELSH